MPAVDTPHPLPLDPDVAAGIGLALRARRKSLGISTTAAAEAAHISRVTWHRLEKGEVTVAWGSLLVAARVLDLDLRLHERQAAQTPAVAGRPSGDWLPLHIRLDDYAQLRALAWQVGDGAQTLTPREALGVYERNWRHVEQDRLEAHELALIKALQHTFDTRVLNV